MKVWQLYGCLILFFVIWLLPAIVSAEERKDEWKQDGYAFEPMKLVYVESEFAENVQADDLKRRILIDKVGNTFSRNLKFAQAGLSFLGQDELVKRLSSTSGEDVAGVALSDPERYAKIVKEGAAFYCQGILEVRFKHYENTVRHIPERIEPYQTDKQVHINKTVTASNGQNVTVDEWVSVPVMEARVIPEHDEITEHTAVELTLTDTKTGKSVWKMVDSRDAVDKDKDGMIDRILKRASDRLVAVRKT
ncbi:MAG: hypothetical protein H6Q70_3867 [Firmicutes bacterium]|nr:hypothetical protein [Bacillota bacterium]